MDCTYIFFDERYEHDEVFCSLIVSAILVSQSQYDTAAPDARFQRKKSRLAEVHKFSPKSAAMLILGSVASAARISTRMKLIGTQMWR